VPLLQRFQNPHAEIKIIVQELNELKTEPVEEFNEHENIDSELDEIEEIINEVEEQDSITEKLLTKDMGLREKLFQFDIEFIRKELPNTKDNERLLRPAMLEAFIEYMPCSKSEFLEYMPPYLRKSTCAKEGQFLDNILEIINVYAE